VFTKLPNRPSTPFKLTQIQLILNGSSPLNLLINAGEDYVTKATQAIKNTMFGSPIEQAIKTIEYLNANNAILCSTNSQLVASARALKEHKKGKPIVTKARVLSKAEAEKLRAEMQAKEAADIAHKAAIGQKKKEQAHKKTQEETAKARRAIQRVQAKNTRETNAEMSRMGRVDKRVFE
jgi:hypothetical protein